MVCNVGEDIILFKSSHRQKIKYVCNSYWQLVGAFLVFLFCVSGFLYVAHQLFQSISGLTSFSYRTLNAILGYFALFVFSGYLLPIAILFLYNVLRTFHEFRNIPSYSYLLSAKSLSKIHENKVQQECDWHRLHKVTPVTFVKHLEDPHHLLLRLQYSDGQSIVVPHYLLDDIVIAAQEKQCPNVYLIPYFFTEYHTSGIGRYELLYLSGIAVILFFSCIVFPIFIFILFPD